MGFISLEQSENLFWLGRYTERVYLTLTYLEKLFDVLIDKDPQAYIPYCDSLNIPNVYKDSTDFMSNYLFDRKNPDSVYANLSRAYDNGIILRNSISSNCLAYLQMSLDTLEEGKKSNSYGLLNQQIIDYLLAFWGGIDEFVGTASERHLIKAGRYLERLDMQLRLGAAWEEIEVTLGKMERRLKGAQAQYATENVQAIWGFARKRPLDPNTRLVALNLAQVIVSHQEN